VPLGVRASVGCVPRTTLTRCGFQLNLYEFLWSAIKIMAFFLRSGKRPVVYYNELTVPDRAVQEFEKTYPQVKLVPRKDF